MVDAVIGDEPKVRILFPKEREVKSKIKINNI